MERAGFTLPLLIGGATTSRQHTAVKIAPRYDASRPCTCSTPRAPWAWSRGCSIPSSARCSTRRTASEQARLRELARPASSRKPLLPLDDAHDATVRRSTWSRRRLADAAFLGRRVLDDFRSPRSRRYIDWTFFFTAWELRGKFPGILAAPASTAQAARELFDNAQAAARQHHRRDSSSPRAPCTASGRRRARATTSCCTPSEARRTELTRFPMLRQQQVKTDDEPYLSPGRLRGAGRDRARRLRRRVRGHGRPRRRRARQARSRSEHDDYSAIMVKALADRLAEAFAELLHAARAPRVGLRRGRAALSNEELIAEKYRGIRPAFGYPACPDHTEKRTLFELLDAEDVGITLTEHFAMMPAASVSGLYLAHPEARYFTVGKIDRDQVEDYAARKGMTVAEVERWLAPEPVVRTGGVGQPRPAGPRGGSLRAWRLLVDRTIRSTASNFSRS